MTSYLQTVVSLGQQKLQVCYEMHGIQNDARVKAGKSYLENQGT